MMHKKDMIFLSILIACSESVVLFYFCSAKSPRSFLCMMISYAILLIFPLNIFLASLREHRTGTSLSTLETTEESSKQQREIEQFTHKQLKLHKNNFTQKLKELYILLEQNDLTTAQKILGEQIPLLISLFSNLLDNAIESCQMASSLNPKIELSIDYKGDFLIIFMQNTKETALIFNSLARKTTKSDSLSHGFGLSIIEEIVKSYDGFCEWEDRGNIFESRIMLRYLL